MGSPGPFAEVSGFCEVLIKPQGWWLVQFQEFSRYNHTSAPQTMAAFPVSDLTQVKMVIGGLNITFLVECSYFPESFKV